MPRGAIHQAEALPQEHSLHVTISVNQRRTWADFLAAGRNFRRPRGLVFAGLQATDVRQQSTSSQTRHSRSYTCAPWAPCLEQCLAVVAAALPAALEQAAAEDVALRTATPPDLIDFMGVAFSDRQPERRAAFAAQARAMAEVGTFLRVCHLLLDVSFVCHDEEHKCGRPDACELLGPD